MRSAHRLAFALAIVLGLQVGPVSAGPISSVYAFGDSNVDTGNLFGVLGQPGGRNSNGRLITEYVAQRFGVPLTNYAWSGATSGITNVAGTFIPSVLNTGLLSQVVGFSNALGGGAADPNALYIVWAGSNDLFGINHSDSAAVASRVNGVVSNLTQALTSLDALGADQILVATRTPRPSLTSADNLAGITLNAAIRGLISGLDESLGAEIEVFDAYALIEQMVLNPSAYGFTEASALCSLDPLCATDLTVASHYINWDAAHKTTRVHELLAEAMLRQVPEPTTLALLAISLLALGWISRRRPFPTSI